MIKVDERSTQYQKESRILSLGNPNVPVLCSRGQIHIRVKQLEFGRK